MLDRRLLVSFAHPDDESFGLGGLICKYVEEGVEASLICATNGDVGVAPKEMLDGYRSVGEMRLAELDCAAEKLGLKQVFKLGYKDSGMMGSETSKAPDSLWHHWQHSPEAVVARVVDVIRQVRPQVIITFNRYGGYGHPDHIAIQQATEQAFYLAGDPDYQGSEREPYQPVKLYYSAIPAMMLRIRIIMAFMRGQNPRKLGINEDIDMVEILNHIEPAHAKVDIRNYLQAWDEVNACHKSQGGGGFNQFPLWLRKLIAGKQAFTRAYPPPERDVVDEDHLFASANEN